jgi:hypothetical protein
MPNPRAVSALRRYPKFGPPQPIQVIIPRGMLLVSRSEDEIDLSRYARQ